MTFSFELTTAPAGPVAPRTGRITTARGVIRTPAFMPVGTLATVKALMPGEVAATGADILLVNAYHLYLRPGHELIERLGGVHAFMGWDGPILSDSGGFQVFSLATIRKVTDRGVTFRSHIDGSEHEYTPELAMRVQAALGVDIAMPLDHVIPGRSTHDDAQAALVRTLRWYERSARAAEGLTVFPIIQGGTHLDLRRRHAREAAVLDAPGYGIGGLSVGEEKSAMWETAAVVTGELPLDRPRYLMGVGSPEDLVTAVGLGVDMFDCVLPTRLGRNGSLFTDEGRITVTNARYREEPGPPVPGCDCALCMRFSMAYLHHLFRNEELLAYRLASIHNVRYLVRLTERLREVIEAGRYDDFASDFLARYRPADARTRDEQREKWLSRSRPV